MAKYYDGWDILTRIENDIPKMMEDLSEVIVKTWRDMVTERFYEAYTPTVYNRDIHPFETRDSINILSISNSKNGVIIEIGYDISKIHTYKVDSPYSYTAHEDPSKMPELFEYGGIYGHDNKGIRAMDDLIDDIKSGKFNKQLKQSLKKLGYDIEIR